MAIKTWCEVDSYLAACMGVIKWNGPAMEINFLSSATDVVVTSSLG